MLLMACTCLMAQPRLEQPEMFVGAYGGATVSTVFFSPKVPGMEDFLKVPLGYNVGAVFRYGGHKVCSFQVEAGYAQRGWREYATDGSAGVRYQANGVNVPIQSN